MSDIYARLNELLASGTQSMMKLFLTHNKQRRTQMNKMLVNSALQGRKSKYVKVQRSNVAGLWAVFSGDTVDFANTSPIAVVENLTLVDVTFHSARNQDIPLGCSGAFMGWAEGRPTMEPRNGDIVMRPVFFSSGGGEFYTDHGFTSESIKSTKRLEISGKVAQARVLSSKAP